MNSVSLSAYPAHMLVYSEIWVAWNDSRDLFEHAVSCVALYQTGLE